MSRYRGYLCDRCKTTTIRKGTWCGSCKTKALEEELDIRFNGNYARPSATFWSIYRKDKNALRLRGIRVEKDNKTWWVRKNAPL